jgi:hypothetical protein
LVAQLDALEESDERPVLAANSANLEKFLGVATPENSSVFPLAAAEFQVFFLEFSAVSFAVAAQFAAPDLPGDFPARTDRGNQKSVAGVGPWDCHTLVWG